MTGTRRRTTFEARNIKAKLKPRDWATRAVASLGATRLAAVGVGPRWQGVWFSRAYRAKAAVIDLPAVLPDVNPPKAILEGLGWFKVKELRGLIRNGEVAEYQVSLELGFRLLREDERQDERQA